jgi:hypothetical protein
MTQDSSGWFIGCPVRVLHQGGNFSTFGSRAA